ncbi:hypothetical protein HanXRQr2_Chr05g0219041 [Helianthus annuus]|uniref:Uncharacterized protein n=1 Tax=Helianthus annuus TaxID=4232 RepID=A0A9K3NNG7_HELAN|nr:hypothetical protein HanXRQr2_Chr05g0219041 [Helianthus annuus]
MKLNTYLLIYNLETLIRKKKYIYIYIKVHGVGIEPTPFNSKSNNQTTRPRAVSW